MNRWHVQSPEFQFVNNADEHCNWLSTAWIREKNPERFRKRHPNVSPSKQLLLYSFTSEEKKLYLSPFHVHSFLFRWDGKGKKKRWFWRPSWSVGWRSTAPKPQHLPTSSASDGEGVGGAEARERGREGWEGWEGRSEAGDGAPEFFFFSFPNPAAVGEKYTAGLEFLERSLTWT